MADLTAPISYNGLTASGLTLTSGGSPSVGILIETIDISNVDVDAYMEKRAVADGLDAADLYLGARRVVIDGAAYGSTRGHAFDQLQSVLRAFSPRLAYNADTANLGFLAFQFRQPTISTATWSAGYIPLQMYLRPLSSPTYTIRRLPTGGVNAMGMAIPFRATLVARDPRKYVQTTQSISFNTITQTVQYRGDYPAFGIVTFSVSSPGASQNTQIVVGNLGIAIGLQTVSSGDFSLDYARRTLFSGTTNRADLIAGLDGWSEVQAGTTVYTGSDTGLTGAVVTLTYREAFA